MLVSTGRGGLVDALAVIQALKTGKIGQLANLNDCVNSRDCANEVSLQQVADSGGTH